MCFIVGAVVSIDLEIPIGCFPFDLPVTTFRDDARGWLVAIRYTEGKKF